jgi:hypothetical protein
MSNEIKRARAKARVATPSAPVPPPKSSKLQQIAELLRRPQGAAIEELMQATGWQAHSVRGALSAGIRRKMKLALNSEKHDGRRVYRVVDEAAQ